MLQLLQHLVHLRVDARERLLVLVQRRHHSLRLVARVAQRLGHLAHSCSRARARVNVSSCAPSPLLSLNGDGDGRKTTIRERD